MATFTTDVIASCAFGIDSNSLKDSDSEFERRIRTILDFSVKKALVLLTEIFAPHLKTKFRMKFMDDKINNYVMEIVWSTVEYRCETGIQWSTGEKLG